MELGIILILAAAVFSNRNCGRLGVFFLLASLSSGAAGVSAPYEPATLSVGGNAATGMTVSSTPLRLTGYRLQTSPDLVEWRDTEITFGPATNAHCWTAPAGDTAGYFRLTADQFLVLRCLAADATTIQLNWQPLPTAVEYKVYRNLAYIGSTAGRTGYFLDNGLSPGMTNQYQVLAFDHAGREVGRSSTKTFATGASSAVRSRYTMLALAFYPQGPNAAELSHIRTYLKHRIDFLRLASQNSALLEPYHHDVLCVRAAPPTFAVEGFNIDYIKLVMTAYPELEGYSIVDLVEKGDIDGVWVTRAPAGCNFYENALVGNKDLNSRGVGERWNPAPAQCSRSFFVNSYESDARSYDAYAHMVEGIMSSICDGYPATWPRDQARTVYSKTRTDFTSTYSANLHLFERFRLADTWGGGGSYASPGNGHCGTSHFPPNSRRDIDERYDGDYAYYDRKTWQRYIDCGADEWLRYPHFTGAKRKLNGYDFGAFHHYLEHDPAYGAALGASPEKHFSFRFGTDSYHQWWFNHLPHNPGVTDGKLNNWWPYLYDFNRFTGDRITYPVSGFPEIPAAFPSVDGEYGTELETAELWGYWHSCSDFGPNGQISIVKATGQAVRGKCAVRVGVEEESFVGNGRHDAIYPITRNARWNLSDLREVSIAIRPAFTSSWLKGANPVIRLCANGGNRIELAPLKNGVYANLFLEPAFKAANGWFVFAAPIAGNAHWEVNPIGYIAPHLTGDALAAAKQQLTQRVLSEVNYIEISLRSDGGPGNSLSYYLDALEFRHAN